MGFLIPRIALKSALLPIVVVVVLCVLSAVPLAPSLTADDPVKGIDPSDPQFPKKTALKKAIGLPSLSIPPLPPPNPRQHASRHQPRS